MGKKKPTLIQRARMNPYANPIIMNHIANNGDIERSNLKRQQQNQGYNNHRETQRDPGRNKVTQEHPEGPKMTQVYSERPAKYPYKDLMAMNHRLNEEIVRSQLEHDRRVDILKNNIKGLERKCKGYEDQVKHLLGRNQELEQDIQQGTAARHLIAENNALEEQLKSKNDEIHANNEVLKLSKEQEQLQKKEINEMKEVIKNQSQKIVEQCIELESNAKTIKKLEDAKNDEREVIHSTEVRTKYIEVHTIDSDEDDKGTESRRKRCERSQLSVNPVGIFESDLAMKIKTENIKTEIKSKVKSEK